MKVLTFCVELDNLFTLSLVHPLVDKCVRSLIIKEVYERLSPYCIPLDTTIEATLDRELRTSRKKS